MQIPFTFLLDGHDRDTLRRWAFARKCSVSEIIRDALRQFLSGPKPPQKEDQRPGESEPLLSYNGIIYVRSVGRWGCLVDLEGGPQFEDELLGERFYEATITVTKEVPEPVRVTKEQ